MYAALFEMTSWMGCQQYIFKGNTASALRSEFERVQDLGCLVRMGRSEEKKKGQKELDKLEAVLNKYYDGSLTPDDLRTLNISISIGAIKCVCIEEGDDAMDKLRTQYPNAR